MRPAMALYRLGALGLFLAFGVFWEEPILGSLRQNPASWASVSILYGFTVVAGAALLTVRTDGFSGGGSRLMFFSHGLALISVLWLLLWCFVWLDLLAQEGNKAEMLIKHTAYLHLFGVGFSMAGYATGWMADNRGERSARFLMTAGWAAAYMAWFNLYLQPSLKWLWAPALGGLGVTAGAFLLSRGLRNR